MKSLLWLFLWFLVQFRWGNCLDTSQEILNNSQRVPTLKVERIRIHGERKYLLVSTRIHDDLTQFDLHVRVNRELGSNHLVMNINMRAMFEGDKEFKRIFELRRLNFCDWLTEYNENFFMRAFFKKSMELSAIVVCPVKVGNYSLINVDVSDNVYPENMVPGVYKYFLEIAEVSSDVLKLFALQVTTEIYFKTA